MNARALLAATAAATALLALSATAHAGDLIISGNSAAFGNGPIVTYDYTTGTLLGSFVPDGAKGGNFNGRGLAVTNNEFFYTELTNGFGPSDGIHIAPFNGGMGGHDIGLFSAPILNGVQDLAFGKKGLYALTGYPNGPSVVYLLNPTTGAVISSTPLQTSGSTDGFTVLNDGTFIANLADGAGTNLYQHFDASGNPLGPTFSVPCGCGSSTGVDISPDGLSLFYATNFNSFTQTDLNNNFLSSLNIGGDAFEDIGLQQDFTPPPPPPPGVPEPATWAMMLLGFAGLGLAMRRKARMAGALAN